MDTEASAERLAAEGIKTAAHPEHRKLVLIPKGRGAGYAHGIGQVFAPQEGGGERSHLLSPAEDGPLILVDIFMPLAVERDVLLETILVPDRTARQSFGVLEKRQPKEMIAIGLGLPA